MSDGYPRLRLRGIPEEQVLRLGGPLRPQRQLLAREVFRIAFYMPYDHPDIFLGVGHAMDGYVRAVGEGPRTLTNAHINYSEGGPLTAERWDEVRRVLQDTRRRSFPDDFSDRAQREIEKRGFERGILLTGGFGIRNGYELEYKARIPWWPAPEETLVSQLTATLPMEYLEEHGSGRVRQLSLDMASKLPFASGHAGLAVRLYRQLRITNYALRTGLWDDAFRAMALRHPGIDLRTAWGREEWLGHRVDGVHWLNFLGPSILARLGGAAALRSRLHSTETALVDLAGDCVVVSLGEQPDAGDLVTGKVLPAYREFAQVVEPCLEPLFLPRTAPIERPRYTSLRLTETEAQRWWRRFLVTASRGATQ